MYSFRVLPWFEAENILVLKLNSALMSNKNTQKLNKADIKYLTAPAQIYKQQEKLVFQTATLQLKLIL